jgi:1,4-dihydroxy-6-naphthoate synthase
VTLAYSVDADDAFMFHAVRQGAVDTEGLTFTHERGDTAALNALAAAEGADVVAVSLGAVPAIASRYLLLPHGASVGRGYGPVLVSRAPIALADLAGRRVGIPGHSTTAWLVLRLMQAGLVPVVVPIAPFQAAFDALDRGEVDAALLIHEGRLLYEGRGYHRVAEVGEWWQAATGLPLPLGVNVIRKGLGDVTVARVSRVLRRAIVWALGHKREVIATIAAEARGDAGLSDARLLDRYLGMYANHDTAEMAPDVREAIDEVWRRAGVAGLLGAEVSVGWAP